MEKPFEFIEYKMQRLKEFKITEGHQPTYALFFLKEGSFSLNIGGEQTVVRENDCVVFSDDLNFLRNVIEPISFVYLEFKINPKCPFSLPIPSGKIHFKNKSRVFDSIKRYEEIMESGDIRAKYYKEHLLEDILLQAFSENNILAEPEGLEARTAKCRDALVVGAAEYIAEHIREKLEIKEICRRLCTNPTTLNFKFRKELSCSVGEFILEEKMKRARNLILNTTYTIGDVARRCGYDNIYYFSTVFSKFYKMSPTDFRRNYGL